MRVRLLASDLSWERLIDLPLLSPLLRALARGRGRSLDLLIWEEERGDYLLLRVGGVPACVSVASLNSIWNLLLHPTARQQADVRCRFLQAAQVISWWHVLPDAERERVQNLYGLREVTLPPELRMPMRLVCDGPDRMVRWGRG